MSVIHKAAVYLGLVDDENDDVFEYEPYDDDPSALAPVGVPAPVAPRSDTATGSVIVRPAPASASVTSTFGPGTVIGETSVGVRRVHTPAKVHVMEPHSFNDAQEVGERLKNGQPVILSLQGCERDLQRRLIDFSSGLCFALNGTMAKAADQVFLLTPPNVEVSDDEKDRLRDRGLYRH
jgi:cell division inhibitor SepF